MLRVVAVAAAVGAATAVTSTTNTPTDDSNYMVMQGDVSYTSTATASVGAIEGRVQMVRSALYASTNFSYSLHFAGGPAPAPGTEIIAKLGRHVCAIEFTAYQDPYQCPGYVLGTNTNTCPSNSAVEVEIPCTVDSGGACAGSFDWNVYIPEVFEGQQLEDMSLYFSHGDNAFGCGNFDADRTLAVIESSDPRNQADSGGNVPAVVLGEVDKDELGYTHVDLALDDMTPGMTYTVDVSTAPCSTLNVVFAPGNALLSHSFTAAGDGTAEVDFSSARIESASTLSITLSEGSSVIRCFSLETGAISIQARLASSASSDGCSAWSDFYTVDEASNARGGRPKGKKQSALAQLKLKGKKKPSNSGLESDFMSVNIDGQARCCMRPEAQATTLCVGGDAKKGKCRTAAGLFAVSESRKAQTGLGAGIAGAIILMIGVALHVRRRTQLSVDSELDSKAYDLSEKTPLRMG